MHYACHRFYEVSSDLSGSVIIAIKNPNQGKTRPKISHFLQQPQTINE